MPGRGTCCRFLTEISGLTASALNTVSNIPFFYGESQRNIDVGLSRWIEQATIGAGYCDNDTTRSALTGCPEAIILQVPTENFIAAHVLCAVEPSTNKVPVLTLRVTRFGKNWYDSGGRCDEAFADTTVILPGSTNDPLPANAIRVGEIEAADLTSGDPEQTLPVYLVTVPLKMGEVPELLGNETDDAWFGRGNRHLDIELTKSIRLKNTRRKPIGLPSATHVFGMTLERNPVDVRVGAAEAGNVFYAADNPALNVCLTDARGTDATAATLNWEITDYAGNKTTNAATLVVPAARGATNLSISLPQAPLGYFDAVMTVQEDASGRELWRQSTSFVLLPPDTRTAGAESPFGTWSFNGAHGTCDRLDVVGPLLMKMGMRHICSYSFNEAESNLAPYKLTYSMAPWYTTEPSLVSGIAKNPNIYLGMLYHESGISAAEPVAPYAELLGPTHAGTLVRRAGGTGSAV